MRHALDMCLKGIVIHVHLFLSSKPGGVKNAIPVEVVGVVASFRNHVKLLVWQCNDAHALLMRNVCNLFAWFRFAIIVGALRVFCGCEQVGNLSRLLDVAI